MLISLRATRVNAGLTLAALANKMHTTPKTLSNWENGKTAIPTHKFAEFCEICNMPQDKVIVPLVNDGFYEA